jgi:GH35 family endo-1,4-beta-xylanase
MQKEDTKVRRMRFHNASDFLRLISGIFFGIGIFSFTSDGAGLKDAAAKAYLNFGTAVGQSPSGVNFSDIIKNEFNMLVCENAMKFGATEAEQGKFTFTAGDAVANFAAQNGMTMRGKALVSSYEALPSWLASSDRQQMLAAMKTHIDSVAGHWKGNILEWDVVSEAVNGSGNALRSCPWLQRIGEDYIDSAFVYAHNADPGAFLFYNDYGGEGMNAKADYIYTMVKGMKERGIPIHGVGLECHFSDSVNKADISANMKRLGELGLMVSCTEIDIKNTSANGAAWKGLMEACLENFNCASFVTWGVHDGISWLGSACGCLIWDAQRQPKPAVYDSVANALNNADPAITEKRKKFITQASNVRRIKGPFIQQKGWARFVCNNNALSFFTFTAQNVHAQIMDIRGKTAVDMDLGMQLTGRHTVNLKGHRLPSGLYFVKIKIGSQSMVVPFTRLDESVFLSKIAASQ